MKKRLIATTVITIGTLLSGCGQVPTQQNTPIQTPVKTITSSGHMVTINAETGTQQSGIAQVTMLGQNSEYQYAVPITKGSIQATLTVPWSGKTSVGVTSGSKTLESLDATVKGPALSEQQLDLLPSYLMDFNIASVATKARSIAATVHTTDRKAIAQATVAWVKTHVHTTDQPQTSRADQTLQSGSGNQASVAALATALLREDDIPAQAVQTQVMSHGMYGTSYSIDVWVNGKWLNVGTP